MYGNQLFSTFLTLQMEDKSYNFATNHEGLKANITLNGTQQNE